MNVASRQGRRASRLLAKYDDESIDGNGCATATNAFRGCRMMVGKSLMPVQTLRSGENPMVLASIPCGDATRMHPVSQHIRDGPERAHWPLLGVLADVSVAMDGFDAIKS